MRDVGCVVIVEEMLRIHREGLPSPWGGVWAVSQCGNRLPLLVRVAVPVKGVGCVYVKFNATRIDELLPSP